MAEIHALGVLTGNQSPNAIIDTPSSNVTINEGESVNFGGTGTDPDNNLPLTYLWQFGAGSGVSDSLAEDPGTTTFNIPGTFTVSFTVTDALGLADPTSATCTVMVQSGMVPDWTGVAYSPFNLVTPTVVTNPVLKASNITGVSARFVADTFLFYESNTWYMFAEILNNGTNQGDLTVATTPDGLHWNHQQIVLNETWHLSYPYIFKFNGMYYMIPETYKITEIRLYKATNFPTTWSYVATLVSGRDFVDSSIFRYNGKWWMFTSDTTNSNCYLYYSDKLTSGWVQHPMSPIVVGDASKARPGGRAFVYNNNKIIRTVQKCNVVYGEKVRIFEVDTLTTTQYAEHEIPESPILSNSGSGWNATGMHQFDPWWTGNHWICAVDGKIGTVSVWSAGIYLSPHPSSPNGVIDGPAGNMTINKGQSVVFGGTGSDQDSNLPLSFQWKFGTGSGISDSTQEDPGSVQFNIPGTFTVTFTVTDGLGIYDPTPGVRIISVQNTSTLIPKTNWSLWFADSQELVGENGAAVNAFDGNTSTIWHTKWFGGSDPIPHEIQINLGAVYNVSGFRYLPRQGVGVNGRIKDWEFYVSTDGTNWGSAVATGTFVNSVAEKEISFTPKTGQYVRLRALSEVNNNPWTSMAEITVLEN
jgi:PKD repeat protein